jgi:hypothetical protein
MEVVENGLGCVDGAPAAYGDDDVGSGRLEGFETGTDAGDGCVLSDLGEGAGVGIMLGEYSGDFLDNVTL